MFVPASGRSYEGGSWAATTLDSRPKQTNPSRKRKAHGCGIVAFRIVNQMGISYLTGPVYLGRPTPRNGCWIIILKKGIDYLVLGCTHYPYLIPVLKEMLPTTVQIIDSGEAVARQTKAVLQKTDLWNASEKIL